MAIDRRRIERIVEVAEEAAAVTIAIAKLRAGGNGAAVATVATVIERELRNVVAGSFRRRRRKRAAALGMVRANDGKFVRKR